MRTVPPPGECGMPEFVGLAIGVVTGVVLWSWVYRKVTGW